MSSGMIVRCKIHGKCKWLTFSTGKGMVHKHRPALTRDDSDKHHGLSMQRRKCNRLRVLGYTPRYLPLSGGAEYGIYELYRRLAGEVEPILLTPVHSLEGNDSADGYFLENAPFRTIRYKRFPVWLERWAARNETVRKAVSALGQISTALHVLFYTLALKPDVIHLNYLVSSYPSARLLKALGIRRPLVLSLIGRPDVFSPSNEDYRRYRRTFDWMFRHVDAGIYQTPSVMGDAPRSERWLQIPYGVKTDELRPHSSDAPRRSRWGTLSRLAANKRVDWVLKAFARVYDRHSEASLEILGTGPERNALEALADSLGIRNAVRFRGYVGEKDLDAALGQLDYFVFASESETFGIVLAQAMAAGLPIAVTDSSCLPEVVVDGENGCVGANTPEGLAAAMLRLMESPETADRIARTNRLKAETVYDWNRIAGRYACLFARLAGKEKT